MKRCQCGVTWKPSKRKGNMNNNKCGHIQTQPDTSHSTVLTEQRSSETAHRDTSWHKTSQHVHKTALKWNGTYRHKMTQQSPTCSQNSAQMKWHIETQADTRYPNMFTKQRLNETAHTEQANIRHPNVFTKQRLNETAHTENRLTQDIPTCSQNSA